MDLKSFSFLKALKPSLLFMCFAYEFIFVTGMQEVNNRIKKTFSMNKQIQSNKYNKKVCTSKILFT